MAKIKMRREGGVKVGDSSKQLSLPGMPGIVQKPTVAEHVFLVLARRWHDGFAVNSPTTAREVDDTALACVLLAVEWGSDFTDVARNKCELNCELASKWFERLPWELCEASCMTDPRNTDAVEKLTANLDHHNSVIRDWCLELAWMCRSWLEKDRGIPLLLKNVADKIAGVWLAMGLACGLCPSDKELNEFIAGYDPPEGFADQFTNRIKTFRDEGFFLTQAQSLDLECRCRRMIENVVLGREVLLGRT